MRISFRSLVAALLALAPAATAAWPTDFVSVNVASGWNQPVGIAFAPDGRMFVWEKAGRVWTVTNGVKSALPIIDVAEEVGDWRDHGMLGFALDPAFATNGHVYLSYVVDFHHLRWFGTSSYDPVVNQYFHDTIGRVTRLTLDSSGPTPVVVPGSRAVLVGDSMSNGIPVCNQSHGVGSLVFGSDGTLLVSCGESSSYDQVDVGGPVLGSSNTALADGILTHNEDVGAFRAQLVDSLSGKILRIDPATGHGIASNPFFDGAAPRAPRSRIWALGLRNPCRMTLEPGTGAVDPLTGDPGRLWITDVGWNSWEEIDVCDGPGLNFGWPLYEGMTANPQYMAQPTQNRDAANPLFGPSCSQSCFEFRELLVQDTAGTPDWPNPCDPAQQIQSATTFVHTRPLVDWFHAANGPARTKTYSGANAATALIGAAGSPLQGVQFGGRAAMGGTWYEGTDFPLAYRHSFYFADYVSGWMHRVVVDAAGTPVSVQPFGSAGEAGSVVGIAADPVNGGLYFIDYEDSGVSRVRRVTYSPTPPPLASVQRAPVFGPLPLTVAFTSTGSTDPAGSQLAYAWDFGDGWSSGAPNPVHVFEATTDYSQEGTIIARTFELTPPHPLGGGNHDPETIRDGDRPPIGTIDSARQYDTYHAGAQGILDWIGYSFATPRTFRTVRFQAGIRFVDGGWFDQIGVEVGDGTTWTPVSGFTSSPAYPGAAGISYQTYRFDFLPATGTHIRLVGRPGGSGGFISVGELQVFADDVQFQRPVRRNVTLTVTNTHGVSTSATTFVALNDTPPSVTITTPVDGSLYTLSGATVLPLTANITDAEHTAPGLACAWQTVLHHDTHVHPEPIDANCATSTVLVPIGCDGYVYFYEVVLTVTDAIGLAGTDRAFVYPSCQPFYVCPGDGSGAACPCGNSGAVGHGCENSFTTGGGQLQASGAARVSGDTLLLDASALPPTTLALFFQGTTLVAAGQGAVFGDGLRCVGGQVRRLGLRTSSAGVARFGTPAGGPSVSSAGTVPPEGGVLAYQAWYRNSAVFCTSATSNLTNAVRITWIP